MRHNQTRNTFAKLLQRAGCKGVEIEQQLLPVEGELDGTKGVEKGDEARMDVIALGSWGAWQRAFFDIIQCSELCPKVDSLPSHCTPIFFSFFSSLFREIGKGVKNREVRKIK